jgi:hypothetical protein
MPASMVFPSPTSSARMNRRRGSRSTVPATNAWCGRRSTRLPSSARSPPGLAQQPCVRAAQLLPAPEECIGLKLHAAEAHLRVRGLSAGDGLEVGLRQHGSLPRVERHGVAERLPRSAGRWADTLDHAVPPGGAAPGAKPEHLARQRPVRPELREPERHDLPAGDEAHRVRPVLRGLDPPKAELTVLNNEANHRGHDSLPAPQRASTRRRIPPCCSRGREPARS